MSPHLPPGSHFITNPSLRTHTIIRARYDGMMLADANRMSIEFNIQHPRMHATNAANAPHKAEDRSALSFDRALRKILSDETRQQQNGDLMQLSQQYIRLLTTSILSQLGRGGLPRLTVNDVLGLNPSPASPSKPVLEASEPVPPHEAPREAQQPAKENSTSAPFSDLIEKAAKAYQLDANLIRAVIKVESNYDAKAVSQAGAQGLMQLMPDTANDLQVDDAFNPENNIMGGSRYLKQLLHRYDNRLEPALAAYNWGMGNLERHPDKLPEETRNYIAKVKGTLNSSAA